jgi:Tfp pilus assembly protein PilF
MIPNQRGILAAVGDDMLRRSGWASISSLVRILTFTVVAGLLAIPLLAQGISSQGVTFSGTQLATPPTTIPRFPDDRVSLIKGPLPPEQRIEDGCFLPPLTIVHSALAGASNLEVSPKARKDYHSACADLHDQKWPAAEEHLRKAVEQYPKYAAAWVTLGQIRLNLQQGDEARAACAKAAAVDPTYLPAHLCLADIAAHQQDWAQVLKCSQRALELNPASDPHVYFYAASADLKLNRLADAERNALKALEIDKQNLEARAHFLLAQIYEVKGDSAQELAQLREYLKVVSDPQDAAALKKYVSDLEAKAAK